MLWKKSVGGDLWNSGLSALWATNQVGQPEDLVESRDAASDDRGREDEDQREHDSVVKFARIRVTSPSVTPRNPNLAAANGMLAASQTGFLTMGGTGLEPVTSCL